MRGKRFVTVYGRIQCYGGAEEGGWYYDVYEHLYSKKCSTAKGVKREIERLQNLYNPHNSYSYDYYITSESLKELGCEDTTNSPRPHYC